MQLNQNEEIKATIYQHWITLVGPIITLAMVGAIETALAYYGLYLYGYATMLYVAVDIIAVVAFLYNIFLWRRNNLIITNQRIAQNLQRSLFEEGVNEILYRDINEVRYQQKGILALAMDYGVLTIRLPSEDEIDFYDIPHPGQVMVLINNLRLAAGD